MIKILLGLGLALIPFFGIVGMDTRLPKLNLALFLALILSLLSIYQGKLKPFKNKWFLILLGYLLISIFFAPKITMDFFDVRVENFWIHKTLSFILIFSLMLFSVSSIKFSENQKTMIFKLMSWVGLIMSLYMVLQFLKLDQFFNQSKAPSVIHVPSSLIGGTLGQPTLAAPFIGMLIFPCLYLRKYLFASIIILALILTHSMVAIGASIISIIFYFVSYKKKILYVTMSLILILGIIFGYFWFRNQKIHDMFTDSGRLSVWSQAFNDIKTPLFKDKPNKYSLTGIGLGSFNYLFHTIHGNEFRQAHNEYIQVFYELGAIGVILLLLSMFWIFKHSLLTIETDKYKRTLLTSFLFICLCACGTFVWQLGAHIYYTITFLGLLHNEGGV